MFTNAASHDPLPEAGYTKDVFGGPEDLLQSSEDSLAQLRELGAPVVDWGPVHRPQNPVRNVRGSGELQEVSSGPKRHGSAISGKGDSVPVPGA